MAHMFGWCNDGHHLDDPVNPCRGEYRCDMGVRKGQMIFCACPCHGYPADVYDQPESNPAPDDNPVAQDETPDERHEEQHESTRPPTPGMGTSRLTYYVAVRLESGSWEIHDPDSKPAKVSGETSWASQTAVEAALFNANRRKVAREWTS